MQRWAPSLLLALTALLVASCDQGADSETNVRGGTATSAPSPTLTLRPGDPVIVGVSVALSGDQAALGADLADAVDLAIEDYAGTIKGHALQSMRLDDGCTDPEAAAAAADELLEAGAAGVVGPMCTTGSQAANRLYERSLTPHLSPAATRAELSQQGHQYFFRTAWRDDALAITQAEYARDELGAETAMVVDDGDPYGKTLADAFVAAFEDGGGSVVARERIQRGETDFSALARQAENAEPDVTVFAGFDPEGGLFLKALRAEGYEGTFIGPDALLNAREFASSAGSAAEGAILVGGAMPDQTFQDRFLARFGRLPATPFVLQAYDATRILLQSIQLVALEDEGGGLTIDLPALGIALHATEHLGLTGTINFDENGDREGDSDVARGLRIYRYAGSDFAVVE